MRPDTSYETSHKLGDVEWIRFLLFLIRQDLQDHQEFFRLRREHFGRRPHYPNDPVDPVQLFSLR